MDFVHDTEVAPCHEVLNRWALAVQIIEKKSSLVPSLGIPNVPQNIMVFDLSKIDKVEGCD